MMRKNLGRKHHAPRCFVKFLITLCPRRDIVDAVLSQYGYDALESVYRLHGAAGLAPLLEAYIPKDHFGLRWHLNNHVTVAKLFEAWPFSGPTVLCKQTRRDRLQAYEGVTADREQKSQESREEGEPPQLAYLGRKRESVDDEPDEAEHEGEGRDGHPVLSCTSCTKSSPSGQV